MKERNPCKYVKCRIWKIKSNTHSTNDRNTCKNIKTSKRRRMSKLNGITNNKLIELNIIWTWGV